MSAGFRDARKTVCIVGSQRPHRARHEQRLPANGRPDYATDCPSSAAIEPLFSRATTPLTRIHQGGIDLYLPQDRVRQVFDDSRIRFDTTSGDAFVNHGGQELPVLRLRVDAANDHRFWLERGPTLGLMAVLLHAGDDDVNGDGESTGSGNIEQPGGATPSVVLGCQAVDTPKQDSLLLQPMPRCMHGDVPHPWLGVVIDEPYMGLHTDVRQLTALLLGCSTKPAAHIGESQ
ncbi:MAG: hypothetical protein KDK91_33495 [Gammaproteobacteria bacterium]|nr:hypothetical protein [Gammaproteobacteria bacterium]